MAFNPDKLALTTSVGGNSRKIPQDFQGPLDEISKDIGEVVWAWNYCHSAFHRLFGLLVNPQVNTIGFTVWHEIQNDSTQRKMLLTAARAALKKHPRKCLAAIEWAVERTDKLGTKRNDVIHLATGIQVSTKRFVTDAISARPNRVKKYGNEPVHTDLPLLRGDLMAMANYVNAIWFAFHSSKLGSWPRRPRLLSIAPVQRSSKRNAHRSRKQNLKPKSQPRSSPV